MPYSAKRQTLQYAALLLLAICCTGCGNNITPTPLPPQTEGARSLLLVVHGSGDTAEGWPAVLIEGVKQKIVQAEQWDFVAYDWSCWADDKASASRAGLEIGAYIGSALASADYRYERIQMVAHSVGAFVIQAACDSYRGNATDSARMHLTFLDPFAGNGLLDWTYGQRRFGEGADFAEAYINTDDPVPSTNGAMSQAHNFDVTAKAPDFFAGAERHWWPVDFYRESIQAQTEGAGYPLALMATGDGAPADHEQFPRGATTIVP